jgi:hypothetical protein
MSKSQKRLALFVVPATVACVAIPAGAFGEGKAAEQPSCRKDWEKCFDNGELINSYVRGEAGRDAIIQCRDLADRQSKHGAPDWPWFDRFGRYRAGRDFPKTGVITIVDRQVIFLDAYGSQARISVTCQYDLRSRQVQNMTIEQDKVTAITDRVDSP